MPSTAPRILALFGGAVLFGQERGNIEALASLKASGCEVLCLVRDEAWHVEVPAALEARGLACRKVSYIEQRLPGRLKYFVFHNPVTFLRANWQFWRVAREFKPTHIYAFNSLYILNFFPSLMLIHLPIVYRAGDAPARHNLLFRWIWSFIVRRTRRFVANSGFVARELIGAGVQPSRVTVIYNKPPTRPTTHAQFPARGIPNDPDRTHILYVGQLIPDKGVHLLAEAFRSVATSFPKAALLIAGRISDWKGDAWARDFAARVSDDPALRDRVVFLGYVENVGPLFAASRFHVCPTVTEEPSANVVMEAKEAGCPSIVFPSGGLPEMVEHEVDGLICESKTAAALEVAMIRYLADPEEVSRHGRAARQSLERLGVARFAETWKKVVEEAVT